MSGFDTTLDVLLDSANRDAPRLLGHVLIRGDMRLRERAVERLMATTDGRRQALLVHYLDCLGHNLETRVLGGIGHMGAGLRHAMTLRDPRMQVTVVRMVRDTQDQSLAYLVGEAACSADQSVRGQAVDLLWRWSVALRRQEMALDGPAEMLLDEASLRRRTFVTEGLQRAFTSRFAAESPRTLCAAAMLADRYASWFWGAMNVRRDTRRRALMAHLAETLEPEMLSFLVQALDREGLAGDAAGLLHQAFDGRTVEALLREFARRPALSAPALRRLREAPWLGAGEVTLEQAAPPLVTTALALAAGSGMPRPRLAILCRSVAVNHREPEARRVALEALAHSGEAAGPELRIVAETAPQPSAGAAILHLLRRGELAEPSGRVMMNLLRDWWDLSPVDRREVGRGLASALRGQPELLRDHLAARGEARRRAAVALVRLAQVADVFDGELKAMAADARDTQLQSAALSAIAEGAVEGLAAVLHQGLGSWDARVRANALEALDRREARDDVFLRFTDDPSPRVRANAARALIDRNRPEGSVTLRRMLTGGEAERLSALWVFSRTRPDGFVPTARLLASRDPSGRVRGKAAELLKSA